MIINMWSGPRNISTALMRSFENRDDTEVWDEPFYAYYLFETKKKHPMHQEIIEKYETDLAKLIYKIKKTESKDGVFYLKQMTHHMLPSIPMEWSLNHKNCLLIRNPKEVINSYSQKNEILNIQDIGFYQQFEIYNFFLKHKVPCPIIDSKDILINPEKSLKVLCDILGIKFSSKMISWPEGKRETDGIWESHWYQNVQQSTEFTPYHEKDITIPNLYENLLSECMDIYQELNKSKIDFNYE